MKIDRSRLKKSTSEVPPECRALIEKLTTSSLPLEEVKGIDAWTFGKCELYHWIDVLDIFDKILEDASRPIAQDNWVLACDLPDKNKEKELLLWVLNFTTLLIEHSFSRHLYNSMEHLITLLASCNMDIVLGVLNLLYMFSKRSNFITRLNNEKRQALIRRLTHLAETWSGQENEQRMADCCLSIPTGKFQPSSSTLHYEYYAEVPESQERGPGKCKSYSTVLHIENLDRLNKTPAEIMNDIVERYAVPKDKQIMLFTHIRLTVNFNNYEVRLLCVQARLQAISILAYSNALAENAHAWLDNGLLEELVEVVECQDPHLVEIRAAALRTLTSIIHLDRNPHFPKRPGSIFGTIVDVTGASSYHGILPVMVRACISALVSPDENNQPSPFPLPLATALFSFLYHLASYEAGGEALVSCGMMESLLRVINWQGQELEHITFVTRAVRVIDLITNIEMQGFMSNGGLTSFINRLELEVNICRKEQPFEIVDPDQPTTSGGHGVASPAASDVDLQEGKSGSDSQDASCQEISMEVETVAESRHLLDPYDTNEVNAGASTSKDTRNFSVCVPDTSSEKFLNTCLPQRAALLKSMLNFLKKAIQDTSFPDNIRHVMDDSLPNSLRHIISNAEYYGPSLFLLATDVVTVYVFQEPSLLSSLQDSGLCNVVLHALLVKDVPATREVLGSLPNVFSALCLNSRGLESFVKYKPFKRLFKVLLSPEYLGAMRRRRSSDPIGDTASNLGNAMDELMRHQPTLKTEATAAIIQLLEELCELGRDPKYVCWRPQSKQDNSPAPAPRPSANNEGGSSEEEDDDEEEASTSSHPHRDDADSANLNERTSIPLIDYIVNVMKFVDAILSNNSTDDHCREFVAQNGLPPLMSILGLPNLPVDYPVTTAAQHVATVCKSILNLSHEPQVLKIGLMQLSVVLETLKPLHYPIGNAGSSVLLHEVASAPNLDTAFNTASATPLLHAMSAAHGYVVMFVHVCRTGQTDIRALSVSHWASELGLSVLRGLAKLYTSLVWESTLLLGICSEDIIPRDSKFGQADLDKLEALDTRGEGVTFTCHRDRGNPWTSLSNDTVNSGTASTMETDEKSDLEEQGSEEKPKGRRLPTPIQLKYIKPLLGASSRLGRALAELFGLLVKLCVGSPTRQRRGQQVANTPSIPTPPARAVAGALTELLVNGLTVKNLPETPIHKFKVTFLICSVGFTSPMLFDEKKYPYYLMLQKFIQQDGHDAFFDAFQWAITGGDQFGPEDGIENPNLPEGTGEFLDAWLMLLEKMVNPKSVLESPHNITVKQGIIYKAFDPWRYLLEMQRSAFDAVMLMWDRTPLPEYGSRMAELMLTILKHILQGEQIAHERLAVDMEKRKASAQTTTEASSSSSTAVTLQAPENFVPDEENLSRLMDMGFSRERAWEALTRTSSMEQATNYLLDYKWLFQHSELLDDFTEEALSACLRLIDNIPETVYRVCDLLVTIAKRNGEKWRNNMLETLIIDIAFEVEFLLNAFKSGVEQAQIASILTESRNALSLATRIHLFTLHFEGPVFQDMHVPCALVVERSGVLPSLVQLLLETQILMTACRKMTTPKWIAPLLLLLDLLEKVAILSRRRDVMLKATNSVWRWYDHTTGGWMPYTAANNELLNAAYWNGESTVSLLCGRRRYVVHFNCMIQANEESGGRRPVTMSLICRERSEGKAHSQKEKKEEKSSENTGTEDSSANSEPRKRGCTTTVGLKSSDAALVVRACVGLLAIPVDPDTLHAVMRVCLRLTRNFEYSKLFIGLGGVRLLLTLTQASFFQGYLTLSTLLIRHAIEEPQTLRHAMEKVIRTRTLRHLPPHYKEVLYFLRNTAACICRDPKSYTEAARDILRVDLNLAMKSSNVENDPRLILRSVALKQNTPHVIQDDISVRVIHDLLIALIQPVPHDPPPNQRELPEKEKPSRKSNHSGYNLSVAQNPIQLMGHIDGESSRPGRSSNPLRLDMDDNYRSVGGSRRKSKDDNLASDTNNEDSKKRLLLPRAAILKILAEAVRSYPGIAKLLTEFSYAAGQSDLVPEDCSALAFLLDNLLTGTVVFLDEECRNMATMLIVAIASCNDSPDAQTALVCEVKSALLRALSMSESIEKHAHIQYLSGIISLMIDNCPPLVSSPPDSSKNHNYSVMNNIVKVMLRKGLLNDLARVLHSLDLSSRHIAMSINFSLKPLETLTRIFNQPVGVSSKSGKVKSQVAAADGNDHSGSSSEGTHAQGEEMAEDTENTEHDISATAEMMDHASPVQGQDGVDFIIENDVPGLDDVMGHLLNRDVANTSRDDMLSATFELPPEAESGMESDDIVTPPVRIQDGIRFGNEDDAQDVDQAQSSDSDSGSNASDDADEVNNGEDEEEEEEDDALNHAPTNHPLLMARHHNLDAAAGSTQRSLRGSRPRRYQYLQIDSPRIHNPTVIFDSPFRILGPASRDLPVPMLQPLREGTRVVVMENENGVFTEEENVDYMDYSNYIFGSSLNTNMSNVPTALWWWCEEAKLLDGDSHADCAVAVATDIIETLEKHKTEEISRNKERMRKKAQEDSLKKADEKKEDQECEGEMELGIPPRQISTAPSSDLISTADVASATENLADSIVESVLHSTNLPSSRISSDESEFSEVTTGLLNSLSDILPPVSQAQYPENVAVDPHTYNMSVQRVGRSGDSESVPYSSDSNITITAGTSGIDLTLAPSMSSSDDHLSSSVSGPVPSDVPLNPSAPSSTCLTPAPDMDNLDAPEEDFDNSDLLGDSLPPPMIPLEDVLLSNQTLRSSSSFSHDYASSESQSSNNLNPSPGTSPNQTPSHTSGTLQSTELLPRDNEGAAEFSESHSNQYNEPQSALRVSANTDPVEPLDLEAAVSWLRHVEIRTSPRSNSEGPSSSGTDQRGSVQQTPTTSTSDTNELPEGVDPSFLAALPDEMREEVIAEQLRLQRIRQRALQQSADASPASVTEVNPEFLAALPPNIQEEVLAQQRLELQRQAAASANPNDPVDAAAFFQNLPPSLRQAILTDMEDSQISVLPPDLAEEAQNLRREWEARNRQLMQERFFNHVTHNSSALSSILRSSGRVGSGVYGIHAVSQHPPWNPWVSSTPKSQYNVNQAITSNSRIRGRQLLDHDALTCLLVVLFVDEPKLDTRRFHKVIRNVCYHPPSREWLVKTLLSIMDRCNIRPEGPVAQRPRRMSTRSQAQQAHQAHHPHIATSTTPSWLNLTMDAAVGLQASVFNITRHPGKRGSKSHETASITIHAQAAPIVFRHTLELMISLAKGFPGHFLPMKNDAKERTGVKTRASTSTSNSGFRGGRSDPTDFWEILLKLDSVNTSKKGKSVARFQSSTTSSNVDEESRSSSFELSAFGQLMGMLASPVVKKSCMLTDKLLRLLSLISVGLPEMNTYVRTAENEKCEQKEESVPITEQHLKLAINVLTSKSCSEEGLEDATALLLNLSNCPDPTKDLILRLLLDGAMDLANMVNSCIAALLKELKAMNKQILREETEDVSVVERPKKGLLTDRFTNDSVVVTAPPKTKGTCDLQLPSMSSLTTKTSSQAFFLRILKVIVQIRESIRVARKRRRQENTDSLDNLLGNSSTDDQVSGQEDSNLPPLPPDAAGPSTVTVPQIHFEMQTPTSDQHNPQPQKEVAAETSEVNRPKISKSRDESLFPTLSEQLPLDHLWDTLSACLLELAETPDHHAVLVLQPAVEAFFLVHSTGVEEQRITIRNNLAEPAAASEASSAQPNVTPVSPLQSDSEGAGNSSSNGYNWEATSSAMSNLPRDQQKFLKFAETHRTVLNQILRQSSTHLADGPFAVLVDHTRVLDFDVKRRYFRSELDRMDEGIRREELAVHVRRNHVFEDSFRELHRRGADEWKNRFYIVFEGEEGQDAGGLLREWYVIISREIFNPMYALFKISPGDRVTYMINSSSHCNPNHLCYFKFVGRVIAKAIYDNKLLECYFTRSFYKHILGISVKYTDMESEDYSFYQGLVYLMEHDVRDLGYDLTFSAEVQEFGVTDVRDLIPNGRNIPVTEQTKMDYIRLVCQMKMTGAIRKQLNAFLEGFYDIIPKRLISIFNEQELELLISGMPNVDIEDLKSNTEYHKYQPTSLQIQWFWKALRAFDQADRAKFLQFVTGTSKVPLQGFAALEGMNGVQKFQIHRDDRSTDRLPSAHTCFNQLDLPVYESFDKLRTYLQKAIHECSEGFGFA